MVYEYKEGERHWIDGYLQSNLDYIKKDVMKKYDAFLVVSGREGFGKSTLAAQIATYLDPTYCIERCCFTATQFEKAVNKAKKYDAIIFDETMGYLSSRGAMSHFNKKLIKIMSEMRSKQLFIILCIPNFFELDRYPALHRSTGLIHVYKRGYFMSFGYKKKQLLYLRGKKYYAYNVSADYHGRFPKWFPLDELEYEKKKLKSIAEGDEVKKGVPALHKAWREQRDKLLKYCVDNGADKEELANVVGISKANIIDRLRKLTS